MMAAAFAWTSCAAVLAICRSVSASSRPSATAALTAVRARTCSNAPGASPVSRVSSVAEVATRIPIWGVVPKADLNCRVVLPAHQPSRPLDPTDRRPALPSVQALRAGRLVPAGPGLAEPHPRALHLGEHSDRLLPVLAAVAGEAEAAPWRRRVGAVVVVDPDRSRPEASRDTMRAGDVAGPDSRAEPKGNVVRNAHRFVLALERDHDDDGAEDLFLRSADSVILGQENGGLVEVPVPETGVEDGSRAARHEHRSLIQSAAHVPLDPLERASADHRAHLRRPQKR